MSRFTKKIIIIFLTAITPKVSIRTTSTQMATSCHFAIHFDHKSSPRKFFNKGDWNNGYFQHSTLIQASPQQGVIAVVECKFSNSMNPHQ